MRSRHFLPVVLLAMMACSGLAAKSIKVLTPNGNEQWPLGSMKTITWTTQGVMAKVRIILLKNDKRIGVIKTLVNPASAAYSWKVGTCIDAQVPAGNDYKIKIREEGVDQPIHDNSDFNFSITGNQTLQVLQTDSFVSGRHRATINRDLLNTPAVIGIANPKKGDVWIKGKAYHVQWKTSGITLTWVKVSLLGTGFEKVLSAKTQNNGDFAWTIPGTIPDGSYRIQVAANVTGVSEYFQIKAPAPAPTCNSGNPGDDLECLINSYRKSLGLQPVAHNAALRKVAEAHVKDLAAHHPENNCNGNLHSWSKNGTWTGGCYDPGNSATYSIMWLKPKEIAGYNNYGYEIAHSGSSTPAGALNSWKGSPAHHDVILNKGPWTQSWIGMGAAMYGGYAVVWFAR